MAAPLTDQAIAKIKELIMSGEFKAGSKLPREQDLAAKLGLSRNSLREAVRALALIGVLDSRVGDGTYVTSLDADLLLTGMGFVGELLDGSTLLEVHQVRRILEPVATGLAATRLTEEDFLALQACLEQMEAAETTQAFIDADTEFHRIIVLAAGNATLASLIQNLSGGMLRARSGARSPSRTRSRSRGSATATSTCPAGRDAERASAADLLHLSEGEEWLRRVIASGDAIGRVETPSPSAPDGLRARPRTEVHPEGCLLRGRGAVRRGSVVSFAHPARARFGSRSRTAGSAARTCISLTARWITGSKSHRSLGTRCPARRRVGRGRRGLPARRRGRRPAARQPGETPADKGISHISRHLKFLGIDTPGAFQSFLDRARVHPSSAARRGRSPARGAHRAARGCLPRRSAGRACRRRGRGGDRRWADRSPRCTRCALPWRAGSRE